MRHKLFTLVFGALLISSTAQPATILVVSSGNGTIGGYTTSGATVNASLVTGLNNPESLALSGSNVFVEVGGNTIGEYTTTGTTVNAALITGLGNVHQINTFGSNIFVANGGGTNTIGEYTTAGATINSSLISGVDVAHGVASNGSNIFVLNNDNGNPGTGFISEYTTSGALVNASLITGLSGPEEILILGSDIFVTNFTTGTVGEYTTSGGTVNAALISGLNGPIGIATDGSNLYITNALGGTVSEYTTSGVLVNASLISGLNGPAGIVVVPANTPLTITTSSLPDAVVGGAYSQAITAGGGMPPYSFTLSSGRLAPGLTFNGSTGLISGTATNPTSSLLRIQATDSSTPPQTATALLVLNATSGQLAIATTSLPSGNVGVAYLQSLEALDGLPPLKWATADLLPSGLTLNPATGFISGTPTTAVRNSRFLVSVTDATGKTATAAFNLTIN